MADQNITINETLGPSGSGGWTSRLQRALSGALALGLANSPVQDSLRDAMHQQAQSLIDSAQDPSDAIQNAVQQRRNAYGSALDALQGLQNDSPALAGSGNGASVPAGSAAEGAAMNRLQRAKGAPNASQQQQTAAPQGGEAAQGQGAQTQNGATQAGAEQGGQQSNTEETATNNAEEGGQTNTAEDRSASDSSEGASVQPESPERAGFGGSGAGAPAPLEGGALPTVNQADPQTGLNQFEQEKEAAQQAQAGAAAPEVSRARTTPTDQTAPQEALAPATEQDEMDRQNELNRQQQSAKKAKKASTKKKIDFLDSTTGSSAATKKTKEKVLWGLIADCLKPTPEVLVVLPYLVACLVGKFRDDHPIVIKPTFTQSWAIVGILALYGIFTVVILSLILLIIIPFAYPFAFPAITLEAIRSLGFLNFLSALTGF